MHPIPQFDTLVHELLHEPFRTKETFNSIRNSAIFVVISIYSKHILIYANRPPFPH